MSDRVTLFEVGPRDGLQNEKTFVPTENKVALVDHLSKAGFAKIEAASFVSPKWVPQMADGADVMAAIKRVPGTSYAALTPNVKGYERARAAKADEVAIFGSASEGFSQKNINCSIDESLARFRPLVEEAAKDGMPVRGYISCVVKCPYDGDTPPEDVVAVAEKLLAMGVYEISLGDTIGAATRETTAAMLDAVLTVIPAKQLAGHYHDTGGRALSNIEVSLEKGIRTFDSAIGGLGGCPYAPGAKGNVDTIAVYERLSELGVETGLDRDALNGAAAYMNKMMVELSQ
ncbi:MAG: hydroxymethylglutaryl-CoA lyase [Pseudomonadota bacterium]